jgi:hypothetical protein
LITKNKIVQSIKNDITLLMKSQYLIIGILFLLSSSIGLEFERSQLSRAIYRLEKSTFHIISQTGGIITLSTRDLITVAKAQPNINQTAKSTAFHLIKNSFSSFIIKI